MSLMYCVCCMHVLVLLLLLSFSLYVCNVVCMFCLLYAHFGFIFFSLFCMGAVYGVGGGGRILADGHRSYI